VCNPLTGALLCSAAEGD
nr:Chain I, peptide2 [Phage \